MTEATSEASSGPPPAVDLQDPLPESAFFWRRAFSYVVAVALIALLALVVWRLDEAAELRQVAGYLCLLLFMVVTYYMVAPSAEQVVKILQTAKLLGQGVSIRKEATATRSKVQSRVTAERSPDVATPAPRRPMSPQGGFPVPPFGADDD